MEDSNYLTFKGRYIDGKKLPIYIVKNKNTGLELGTIKFYGAWRKFVFSPNPDYDLIFDANCLSDIIIKLNDLTAEWRANLGKDKNN